MKVFIKALALEPLAAALVLLLIGVLGELAYFECLFDARKCVSDGIGPISQTKRLYCIISYHIR